MASWPRISGITRKGEWKRICCFGNGVN